MLKHDARAAERGASLVALLGFMTFLALMAMAIAPSIQQQAQRQREEEAIFRGEEVAEAIRRYALITGRLPTSMDQLTDGVPVPGKTSKLQILRRVAATDPISDREWKLVRSRSQEMLNFHRRVMSYNNGRLPDTQYANLPVFQQELVPLASVRLDSEADEDDDESAPGDIDDAENSSGPFIGVTSRARRRSVINYYGIGRYDRWVFTPLFR